MVGPAWVERPGFDELLGPGVDPGMPEELGGALEAAGPEEEWC